MRLPKSTMKEVTEASASDIHLSDLVKLPSENKTMTDITVSRKVKKVEYKVAFPDPRVTPLSDEQKSLAVQSFFTSRVGYLLRQAVATETDSIQAFGKAYDSMLSFAKAFPTYDGDEAKAKTFVLAHLKSTIPDFRLEPARGYHFGLDQIFEPPKSEELDIEDPEVTDEA